MLEALTCRLCGGDLQSKDNGTYVCPHCGRTFVKKTEDDYAAVLKSLIDDAKLERLSAARQNLWSAMHEEYINSSSCLEYARELKLLVPSDYYANFAEAANGKGEEEISNFLNKSAKGDMETYADAVLDFMIKSMTPGNLTAVCNYIDRAYPKASPEYAKYINLYEEEAEKVESGIYELTMPRDVFVAYSSKDIDKVLELTDYIEAQGISCFISMRNLRHGRGSADNYDKAIQTAIDNCKTIVFISSKNSRSLACDALRKEIPYIRKTDTDGAPAEYRAVAYEKIPYKYKKDRVEYLLDDYANTAADKIVKQFFDGVEWCKTSEDVADRVITYLTAIPEPEETSGRQIQGLGEEDLQRIISAISGGKETEKTSVSINEKEKNVLSHVARFISTGSFDEAEKNLNSLEDEEIKLKGICSVAVYYYKILIEYKVTNDEELIDYHFRNVTSLRDDKFFGMVSSLEDCAEKTRLLQIEKKIDNLLNTYSKGLQYKEKRKYAVVTGIGIAGRQRNDIVIPPKYGCLPVSKVEMAAFMGCSFITSVVIPGSISLVDYRAFMGCTDLTTVCLKEGVEIIGEDAFRDCQKLNSVIIPKSLKKIYINAFCECRKLCAIYYLGISTEWDQIYKESADYMYWDDTYDGLFHAKKYYYCKSKPSGTGNFWHYDENGNPVVW